MEQEFLKSILEYNPLTGVFLWINSSNKKVIGNTAGSIKKDRCGISYLRIQINNRRYSCHRLAWIYTYGSIPDKMEIDHIDGNGLNNSINNLRLVDRVNNQRNKRMKNNNKSGKMGVCFCNTKKKWLAQIGLNGSKKHVGYFDNIDDAIKARSKAEIKYNFHPNHGKVR